MFAGQSQVESRVAVLHVTIEEHDALLSLASQRQRQVRCDCGAADPAFGADDSDSLAHRERNRRWGGSINERHAATLHSSMGVTHGLQKPLAVAKRLQDVPLGTSAHRLLKDVAALFGGDPNVCTVENL